MAISNISALLIVVIIAFLLLTNHVSSESFKFPNFGPYASAVPLKLEGDASVTNDFLQLTKVVNGNPSPNSAGRASFGGSVQLWDAKTGKLASFTTTFSFIVKPNGPGLFGEGISFFIAPYQSKIPTNSNGGFLGLFDPDSALNAYKNQLVAVEFDSFGNPWDPASPHVGININSIASVITVPWQSGNILEGSTGFATINYEPETKNLTVSLEYPASTFNVSSSFVSFVVDFRTVLPQWVTVGFSGATGMSVEQHKILNWFFSSSI